MLSSSRYLLFALALVLLSGCSAVQGLIGSDADNTVPPTPLVEFQTLVEIIQLWSKDTGKGSTKQYLKLTPSHIQGKVFVADVRGNLVAIDATSGNRLWESDADMNITGGPGSSETLTMIGSEEGDVLAYTSESGEFLWQAKVSSEVLAAPQEAYGVVVARTIDGKIFGLDAYDGRRLWVYDRTVPSLTLRGTSNPVITGDIVIAGFDGGRISAIELHTGKLIWETSVSLASGRSQLERMVDIDSDPVIIGNDIYVATFQGRVASVALEDGRITWARDISSYAGLTADENNIYITDDQSYIWALERSTGNSVWKQENLYARRATAPAVIGELVVVGDLEGYLHWMDKSNGQFVARTRVSKDPLLAPPVAFEEIVYAYSSDGTLSAHISQ
ncbi:MAG: outer membrane protein assembly factor BamB [Gammaproteobacteria bacterium]|nr:MAG: outer membrane protein assembly factor BamB [Gammaproteobacteria bacterium]